MLKVVLAILFGSLCFQLARSLGWRRDQKARRRSGPFGKKKKVIDADFEDVD